MYTICDIDRVRFVDPGGFRAVGSDVKTKQPAATCEEEPVALWAVNQSQLRFSLSLFFSCFFVVSFRSV
jgi:hypothetical protein